MDSAQREKDVLHRYLKRQREDLLGKLDGLSDYDARRPLTPSGTNLLGLVKHVASCELEYFTDIFGRPSGVPMPWFAEDAEHDADMWALPTESRAFVVEFHHTAARLSDAVIEELPLDAPGVVPWWAPERRDVTLHQILVHMAVETARHAGHADILREGLDGTAGQRPGDPNQPSRDAAAQAAYLARLEEAARARP